MRAALEQPEARPNLTVKLTVRGGMPSERYDLQLEFRGSGETTCALGMPARERRKETQQMQLAEDEVVRLLDRMRIADLVRADLPQPRIPPDSLVGRLEISGGGRPVTLLFMADPGQARSAGQEPPPQLLKTVSALYDVCARVLGDQWTAP
ncbi:hypothetical protein ACFWN7_08140 [Agromyces sp. NPDC058484]|uniref:hypothetical protein n=1 Tax=Agromyces sp. NPDC058484 TaxID=3346524 RepID=UPI0036561790